MMSLRQLEQHRPIQHHRPKPKRKRVGLRKATSALLILACLITFTLAACSGFVWLCNRALTYGSVPSDTKTTTYTVQVGDTEWGIAGRFQTDSEDTRQVELWIEQHNGLDGNGDLQPGQRLTVPVR